jgi:catechol 2,3-dioxygenase-like lactoylglutathione lyase family enzyme
MSSQFAVKSLDHVVLTVKSIEAAVNFYTDNLGMKHEVFTSPKDTSVARHSLKFGNQKINLHLAGHEFEPKAQTALPGTADLVSSPYKSILL